MHGTPPPSERSVTLENWIAPPYNRWALQHLQELVPCAPVPRASRSSVLARDGRDLGSVPLAFDGERWTLGELVGAIATDAIVALHRGTIVWEHYANGMEPATRHLCFSVTKSVVATLAGILMGRGAFEPASPVTEILPELAGSSWEGATVQQILDMRTGTRFSEVYEDLDGDAGDFGQAIGWFPPSGAATRADAYAYLAGLPTDRDHGGAFDYRSPLTSLLGWLCERAGSERLAALIARELWHPVGAEFDASLAVDAVGNGFGGGGFNATVRDMARFGELWRRGGVTIDGMNLIPPTFVQDTMVGGHDSRQAWADSDRDEDMGVPVAFYRNNWWIHDPERPLMSTIGIHGQAVTIDGEAELVVARFSSLPNADDDDDLRAHLAVVTAIAEACSD
jgi:CubicO group peptidase (beta-lactamase class C family)